MDIRFGAIFEEMDTPSGEEGNSFKSGLSWRMRNLWSRTKSWGAPLQRRKPVYACALNFSRRSRRRLGWARQTCQF